MLLESIKLENFRQFRNETIDFAQGADGKNVTIIIGDNGTGKTTFAQAFFWCMYGETEFSDKNMLNKLVATDMKPGQESKVQVILKLIHGNVSYTLMREQTYRKDYTVYTDGDNYTDLDYIERFKTVLRAIREKQPLKIELENRHGKRVQMNVIPEYLEYSEKDDKFRLITSGCRYGRTINLGRINMCKPYFGERLNRSVRHEEHMAVVSFELFDGRNTLERAMLHFAHYEKRVEQNGEDKYTVRVKYNTDDETELLIRVVSFGPFIKVTEPESFVDLVKNRLIKQKSCGLGE